MIITRTPFRISFAGGGSDIKDYYQYHEGAVLSTSIDKYLYLSAHPYFYDGYLLKYSKQENVETISQIEHRIIKHIFQCYDIKGIDFNSTADIPSGTGLASSSAFTVGLTNLCNAYTGKYMSKEDMADYACQVEIEHLKEPIGKQDQYACAVGGLNFISFHPNDTVTVEKIFLPNEVFAKFEKNLLMFYTNKTRATKSILSEQRKNIANNHEKVLNLHKMVKLAHDLKRELLNGNVDATGEILHEGWIYKKQMASSISDPEIDHFYDLALKNGALGGKILGAGGGGFLLFYAHEEHHDKIRKALDLKEMSFKFDNLGTTIIHYDNTKNRG